MSLIQFFPMNPLELKKKPEKLEALLNDPRWCIQLKRDGLRGELHINPDGDGKNRLFSRNSGKGDNSTPLEMTKNVPTLANWQFPEEFWGMTFDCEIYHPNIQTKERDDRPKTSAELSGVMNPNRKEPPPDWEPEIELWAFDIPIYKGALNGEVQEVRLEQLEVLFEPYVNTNLLSTLWYVETFYTNKAEHVQRWLNEGEEGGVLKNLDSKYLFSFEKEGKRSAGTWVKYKRQCEGDFVILGFEPASREYEGENEASWQFWQDINGNKVNSRPNDTTMYTPITKPFYYGWIGSVNYGAWISKDKLEAHLKEYEAKKLKFDIIEEKGGMVLIKVGNTSGFTDSLREKFTTSPEEYIGKVVKITGMEQFPDTFAIRHPALTESNLRWDKNPEDCKIE